MSGLLFKCIATVITVLAVSLPVAVTFAAAPAAPSAGSADEHPGRLAPGNSRKNSAVLVARNLAPGDSRSETVTITNRDRVPASFTLSKAGVREQPGRGGGKLSAKLELRVEDVTGTAPPTPVYGATVGSMSRQMLGRFMPGESRTYRFKVTFPDSHAAPSPTSADNAYMGGSLSLDLHWRTGR